VRFLVVANETEACPYLPGQSMRLPLRMPLTRLTPEQFDHQLAEGDRRTGPLLYKPACAACSACEAIRVPVARFAPTRSQRRVVRRNERDVEVVRVRPTVTAQHLELYNRHSRERGLSLRADLATERDYRFFLIETCVDTWELQYRVAGRLVAVSILDFGRAAVSSVYHYFDPDEAWRSLGVFSVVRELELCASLGLEWYYLGLYVDACAHLNYKADYWPHQRRMSGVWQEFRSDGP
jgi:arginyl-tRNA--protein-N-Asp/Glu arginylyltransferase